MGGGKGRKWARGLSMIFLSFSLFLLEFKHVLLNRDNEAKLFNFIIHSCE